MQLLSIFLSRIASSLPLVATLALSCVSSAYAKGVYQQPADFVAQAFDGTPPAVQAYTYLDSDLGNISNILAYKVTQGRTRYWKKDNKTVWVLNHTGKTKPITAGFIIENARIVQTKVLIFKETRGWEIRFKYFTKQFKDNVLEADLQLAESIDNVSGATLSVRAMKKMARLALYLHRQVTDNSPPYETASSAL